MVNTMRNICTRYWKVLNNISGLFENDVNESMLIPYKQRLGTVAGDKAVYNDVLMKRCLKTLEYVALYLHYLHLKSTTLVLVQNTIIGLVAVDYERDDDVLAFLAAIVQFYVVSRQDLVSQVVAQAVLLLGFLLPRSRVLVMNPMMVRCPLLVHPLTLLVHLILVDDVKQ